MIPMSEAAELFKPDMYVVCMDSYWVRDAQMIDVWRLMPDFLRKAENGNNQGDFKWLNKKN